MTRMFSCLIVFVLTGFAATLAHAQGSDVLRDTYGDWQVRCIEGTDVCAMSQTGNDPQGQPAMQVTIQRLKGATAENGVPVPATITVQAPLGILIPYSIRVKIDSADAELLPLTRCIPAGCIAQAPMTNEAINKMKAGSKAVFGFVTDRELLIDISLRGFTKAFNNTPEVNPQQGQ